MASYLRGGLYAGDAEPDGSVDASPQPVHNGGNLGDNAALFGRKFVDKAVVAPGAWRLHFVLPEGAGANRQNRTGE
jgi:hypothetical protein